MKKIFIIMMLFVVANFAAETITFDNNWADNPLFNVVSKTPMGIEITFSMHEMVIEEQLIDGVPMKSFGVPGVFLPYEGVPNLMGACRYVAMPQNAQAQLTIINYRTEMYYNIEVAPAPNYPLEVDDSPLKYEKNMAIYSRDAYYPSSPVKLSRPMKIRGVDVVKVGVIPFQYNPVTKELIVYKDIRFRIDFIGSNGHFGEDRLRSRFWEPILQGHLLNYTSLPKIDFYAPERINNRAGYEYIIIVPDDATFEAWGDTIKAWRKLQGISSEVYTLTEVGGSTKEAIKNFLETAYNTWNPAPVAFLILSDYPSSGDVYGITSNVITHPYGYAAYASDNWYADFDNDTLPELDHGRICAQTDAQLSIMINKFLGYERNPYTDASFYDHPLVACGWQSGRWFQMCIESIKGFFENSLGCTPAKEYALISGNPGPDTIWSSRQGTMVTAKYWYNRGWLVDTLNPYPLSYWSGGNAAGINAAINAGAFFVQHRDHGGETAWGHPSYTNTDLDGLSNSTFMYVNSTNCLTGRYHWTSECFTEKFHRISAGALGLNAASSVSMSFANDTYIWGMFDSYWPYFDLGYPGFDMTGYDNLRPCQAMTSGKYYHEAMWFPDSAGAGGYRTLTHGLFHHHGDAFNTLYSEIPQNLSVSHAPTLIGGAASFTVTANDSSVIALTVNGEIIGVAEGTGSPIAISIPAQSPNDTMIVTITKANYYRYIAEVPVIDAGMPEIPTINYPLDFARLPDVQPTLQFYSTDPQDDTIWYRVMWDTDPNFASPESSTTSLYSSGTVVSFTFPSPFGDGVTCWWKVKCTDPGGSGYWTNYTTKRSFSIGFTIPENSCTWYQTTADQFNCNTFNGVIIQGDSVILVPTGQTIVDTIFEEDFQSGLPPNWIVIDGNSDGYEWQVGTTSDMGSYAPPSNGNSYAYYSDDNAGNGIINYNEELISPSIYIPDIAENLEVEYGYGFRVYESGETYEVKARFFSGTWGTWNTIATYTSGSSGTATIDLTSYLPADSVQFEWMYHDETSSSHWGYACACDNVIVSYSYSLSNDDGTMTGVPVYYHDLSTTYARSHWGSIVWHKASAGDSIGIQVEYYNSTIWQLIPDSDLPGNATGFFTTLATDSIDLSALDTVTYNTLRLSGLFYRISTDAPDDPALIDWEIGNLAIFIGIKEAKSNIQSICPMLNIYPSVTKTHLNIIFATGKPDAKIDLKIYDAAGRLVKDFSRLTLDALRPTQIIWDRTDQNDRAVPAGVYFVRFKAGDYEKTEKAILLR
ncbi:hypothetical protein KAX97_03775 [candidate division WOR-3 bacterium]|nr:hypothetical protein [candidate division WOR-3 bacterium]